MEGNEGDQQNRKPEEPGSIRASISFPPNIYEALKQLARKKKVSLAWVVRDAAEEYVNAREKRPERA